MSERDDYKLLLPLLLLLLLLLIIINNNNNNNNNNNHNNNKSSGIAGTTRLSGIRRIDPQSSVTPAAQLSLSAHNRQQPRKAYENLDHHLQHEHTGLTK